MVSAYAPSRFDPKIAAGLLAEMGGSKPLSFKIGDSKSTFYNDGANQPRNVASEALYFAAGIVAKVSGDSPIELKAGTDHRQSPSVPVSGLNS